MDLIGGDAKGVRDTVQPRTSQRIDETQGSDLVDVKLNVQTVFFLFLSFHRLVNLDVLWELSIGLQEPGLVREVLENNIGLFVLVLSKGNEDNVSYTDPVVCHLVMDVNEMHGQQHCIQRDRLPDFLSKGPSNVSKSLDAVAADRLYPSISKHFCDRGILLSVFLELELSLGDFRVVLAPGVCEEMAPRKCQKIQSDQGTEIQE